MNSGFEHFDFLEVLIPEDEGRCRRMLQDFLVVGVVVSDDVVFIGVLIPEDEGCFVRGQGHTPRCHLGVVSFVDVVIIGVVIHEVEVTLPVASAGPRTRSASTVSAAGMGMISCRWVRARLHRRPLHVFGFLSDFIVVYFALGQGLALGLRALPTVPVPRVTFTDGRANHLCRCAPTGRRPGRGSPSRSF